MRSLAAKPVLADRTEDPALRQALVNAYVQELQGQVDVKVSRGHADFLGNGALIGLLFPNPHRRGSFVPGR